MLPKNAFLKLAKMGVGWVFPLYAIHVDLHKKLHFHSKSGTQSLAHRPHLFLPGLGCPTLWVNLDALRNNYLKAFL